MIRHHGEAGHIPDAADGSRPAPNGSAPDPLQPDRPRRPLREVCVDMRERVEGFLAEDPATRLLAAAQEQLRVSMKIVDEALEKYPPEQIALSYNGGKDCLVLLVVILACLARRFSSQPRDSSMAENPNGPTDPAPFPERFQSVYIVAADPFPEVDSFVASSAAEYHLDLERYRLPMKQGLESYLADRPSVRAIFVGIRRADPHGENLKHFDPTDPGWPAFMRVHPVIDWHYAEIWAVRFGPLRAVDDGRENVIERLTMQQFVRRLGVAYCPLYDQGYTSLGGTRDTHPNPQLRRNEKGEGFRPAYELMDDDEERLGRDR